MFKQKNLIVIAILVLLAVMFAVPSLGASFRKKTISKQQFLDMCKEGNTQGVIEAIKAGANVNAKNNEGITALMVAVVNAHTETVNALIKAGADVNAQDDNGMTALIFAARFGYTKTVNALIKAKADLNAKDNDGWTVIMLAAGLGHAEIVNALIKAKADLNAMNNYGMTALIFAATLGHTEIVNTLIEAGADDLTDNKGRTALIHAARSENSNEKTVNALIDAGSYVKQKDNDGKTALDYARNNPKLKGSNALKRLEKLSK